MRYLFLSFFLMSCVHTIPLENPNWDGVLKRQQIEFTSNIPTYQDIETIQKSCNGPKFISDKEAWGKDDYWATPKEFRAKNAGDCEDFAICKYYALRKAGFKAEDLKILLGKSRILMGHHAILSVRFDNKEYILDNVDKTISLRKDFIDRYFVPSYEMNEISIKASSGSNYMGKELF